MKRLLFVSMSFCLWFLTPINLAAEKVVVKTDEKWKDNENDRSLPSVPMLSIDEQNLYIRSSVELTNLDVCIRDSREMKLTILNTTEKTLLIFNL